MGLPDKSMWVILFFSVFSFVSVLPSSPHPFDFIDWDRPTLFNADYSDVADFNYWPPYQHDDDNDNDDDDNDDYNGDYNDDYNGNYNRDYKPHFPSLPDNGRPEGFDDGYDGDSDDDGGIIMRAQRNPNSSPFKSLKNSNTGFMAKFSAPSLSPFPSSLTLPPLATFEFSNRPFSLEGNPRSDGSISSASSIMTKTPHTISSCDDSYEDYENSEDEYENIYEDYGNNYDDGYEDSYDDYDLDFKENVRERVVHNSKVVTAKTSHSTRITSSGKALRKRETESPLQPSQSKRHRRNFSPKQLEILNEWYFGHLDHPYPSSLEKIQLSRITGLELQQIADWFINARRRK